MAAVNAVSSLAATAATAPKTKNEEGAEDRFLKLLVAQMQNQDPLNPMDNAQVTSQMAQIQSVNGLEKLNRTVEGLGSQFTQLAALQGASLVGRDVILPGDRLTPNDEGLVQGGFELASAADSVTVEILNAGGRVIDTVDLGAQGGGRHGFAWTPPEGVDPTLGERFRMGSALLVDRSLGLRNPEQLTPRAKSSDSPWVKGEYSDPEGRIWQELDVPQLVQQPDFLGVAQ